MSTQLRIATFNLENLDDTDGGSRWDPSLDERIEVLKPQLERIRADVLCLQEVHAQEPHGTPRELLALQRLLQGTRYEHYHIETTKSSDGDPYNERNLVVVSRFPIESVAQYRQNLEPNAPVPEYRKVTADPPETAEPIRWERPILHAELDIGDGQTIHVVNVHLKSKIPTDVNGQRDDEDRFLWHSIPGWAEGYFVSSIKRVGQALETRQLVDGIFDEAEQTDKDAFVAVCGDFNADIDSVPVNAIRGPVEETNNPELGSRIMVPCETTVPEPSRYTLLHLGQQEMIDHILVSRPLLAFYRGTEIHNEILPDESGAFRSDKLFPESDHAPVVAEFELP
ncbi:endonuclease/exonuclease/phosphatase family protein [Haladaptatus sp. NG-SE-30]